MSRQLRFLLLLTVSTTLTSCGTASHYISRAAGLVGSVTSPVLGALRLSDSPDLTAPPTSTPANPAAGPSAASPHDSPPAPAKRPH